MAHTFQVFSHPVVHQDTHIHANHVTPMAQTMQTLSAFIIAKASMYASLGSLVMLPPVYDQKEKHQYGDSFDATAQV